MRSRKQDERKALARAEKDPSQLPLFESKELVPMRLIEDRVTRSSTSQRAYDSVKPHVLSIRDKCLLLIHSMGSATADQLEYILDLPSQTITPRLWEACKLGDIWKTGAERKTRRGRMATVYQLTRQGEARARHLEGK